MRIALLVKPFIHGLFAKIQSVLKISCTKPNGFYTAYLVGHQGLEPRTDRL